MIIHGLALEKSKELDDNSINCIITSPPYWQLRDYGFSEQWGLEPTYNEYLEHLWSLFDILKDKLTDDGTCWVNLGDSYNSHTAYAKSCGGITKKRLETDPGAISTIPQRQSQKHAPDKCLLLIPHRFAIGMIDRGWILRNDIIWAKPNGMPESVTDRFSKKHEFIFFFVKSKKYYFDLDSVRLKANYSGGKPTNYVTATQTGGKKTAFSGGQGNTNKNPGDVSDFWAITTKPNSTNHYASYNSQLIDKPIIAGCPKFVCNKCGKPRENVSRPINYVEGDIYPVTYNKNKPYSVMERSGYIEIRDLPDKNTIKKYLNYYRKKIGLTIEQIELQMQSQAPHHWFNGESYPTKEDWVKIKDILGFDDTYDKQMTEVKYKPAEKCKTEYETVLSDCGCNAGFKPGTILDPFCGTGTTLVRAMQLERKAIGIEGNPEYVKIAEKNIEPYLIQNNLFKI